MRTHACSTRLTALIISRDEAPNIARVLSLLRWVERVIVLDSGSTDETLALCARFANVEVHHRAFDSFAAQCNHGLSLVDTEWCLSIDADYCVPLETSAELQQVIAQGAHDGYYARLAYCVAGRRLRRAILPDRIVLFRTRLGHYEQDGHAHRLVLDGRAGHLSQPILHDDRKPLRRWLASQETYAQQEVEKIARSPWQALSWPDRVRRLGFVAPWLVPAYYLLARGGLRDGWAGLDYAAQRAVAELVLSIKLIEQTRLVPSHVAPGDVP